MCPEKIHKQQNQQKDFKKTPNHKYSMDSLH